MGQRMTTYDDMDGSEEDVQESPFTVFGVTFAIDLSPKNREALCKALLPFMECARRTSGKVPPELREMLGSALPPQTMQYKQPVQSEGDKRHSKEELNKVREWCADNGIHRQRAQGRIANEVWDAWHANNPSLLDPCWFSR